MSSALLGSISSARPYYHTPLDDLESFMWVLFWVALYRLRNSLSTLELEWYLKLHTSNHMALVYHRTTILHQLRRSIKGSTGEFSNDFLPFAQLIYLWQDLLDSRRTEPIARQLEMAYGLPNATEIVIGNEELRQCYTNFLRHGLEVAATMDPKPTSLAP
jgi:hypothetical protein